MRPGELPHKCTITPVATVSSDIKIGTTAVPVFTTAVTALCLYTPRSALRFTDQAVDFEVTGAVLFAAGTSMYTIVDVAGDEQTIREGSKIGAIIDAYTETSIFPGTFEIGAVEPIISGDGKPYMLKVLLKAVLG